jgi:hypothetical protein
MILTKIDLIKMVRKITVPQLGLIDAKHLVESVFSRGEYFSGVRIDQYKDLEPIINLCYAYNEKVFVFSELHEIVWGKNPFVSMDELVAISKDPHRYIGS